jgi:hypothetical protein
MDNLLATIVFVLPGFLAYFWIQSFGKNPVVKHSQMEFTAISASLWLPVSFTTLLIYNLLIHYHILDRDAIWTLDELKENANSFSFLFYFLGLSSIVSLIFSVTWVKLIHDILVDRLINMIRKWRGLATLSPTASVWEEFFIRIDEDKQEESNSLSRMKKKKRKKRQRDKMMLLQVYKVDKPDEFVIGSMTKASRPFEPDKALVLHDIDKWKEALQYYDYQAIRAYIDIRSGLIIKELDYENPTQKVKVSNENDVSEK